MLDWQLCQICYPLEIKLLLLLHFAIAFLKTNFLVALVFMRSLMVVR